MKSSSVTPPRVAVRRLFASRSRRSRRCATSRASVASSTTSELIARHRHALEAEHLHRNRGAGLLHRLAALVEQRAHAAGVHAADEVVADLERAVLHEHRGDRALARIELRFDRPCPSARRFGFALRSRISAWSRIWSSSSPTFVPFLAEISVRERVAAELLEHDAVLQQLLLHLPRVRLRQIDLVDRDDDRHAGVLGVRDRLDRLRHDRVVGGDDEHDDVGHLRAARAHRGERLVARRVEERDRSCRSAARRDTRRCAA